MHSLRQLFGTQPASLPSLLLCAPPPSAPDPLLQERADAARGVRNSISPLSTSPFSLLLLLSCSLSLHRLPFFFPSSPLPPPRLLSTPRPWEQFPSPLLSSSSEAPSSCLVASWLPLRPRPRPQPISARPPAAPPPPAVPGWPSGAQASGAEGGAAAWGPMGPGGRPAPALGSPGRGCAGL